MVLQAMAAALSSGKWYTPVLIEGKSTVLQPFSDARVRQEHEASSLPRHYCRRATGPGYG